MTVATLTLVFAFLGAVFTGSLAFLFLRDPERALVATTHRLEQLPKVMADRYFAFTLLALGAVVYGDFKVIAYLFAVYSFLGFADAWIYSRIGKSYVKHFAAGVLAIIVMITALLALNSGVTA